MHDCHEEITRRIQRIREIDEIEELHRMAAGTFRCHSAHGTLKDWPKEESE